MRAARCLVSRRLVDCAQSLGYLGIGQRGNGVIANGGKYPPLEYVLVSFERGRRERLFLQG
jgi:hypothetical protein